jgi:proteasome lid subunit RPN8/RPN11
MKIFSRFFLLLVFFLTGFAKGVLAQNFFQVSYQDVERNLHIKAGEYRQLTAPVDCNLKTLKSNNNVDITQFEGKYFLAYRTAPFHYASKKTRLHILSSTDGENWICEKVIHIGKDLREPRFLNLNGILRLYYCELGSHFLKFEPQRIWTIARDKEGRWSEAENIGLDGFVPWRLRMHQGAALLSAYYGQGLYKGGHRSEVRLFRSADGVHFSPISEEPQIAHAGAEEGEFIFDDNGDLWGTVRLEFQGSFITYASHDNLSCWQSKFDRRKFDSALMFKHGKNIFVVARRNVDGDFAKFPRWLPKSLHNKYNSVRYMLCTKRTALFLLDKEKAQLIHLFDLPGKGDTAFPAIAPIDENSYLLMNYSNDVEGADVPWLLGQWRKSHIYSIKLTFGSSETQVNQKVYQINE